MDLPKAYLPRYCKIITIKIIIIYQTIINRSTISKFVYAYIFSLWNIFMKKVYINLRFILIKLKTLKGWQWAIFLIKLLFVLSFNKQRNLNSSNFLEIHWLFLFKLQLLCRRPSLLLIFLINRLLLLPASSSNKNILNSVDTPACWTGSGHQAFLPCISLAQIQLHSSIGIFNLGIKVKINFK